MERGVVITTKRQAFSDISERDKRIEFVSDKMYKEFWEYQLSPEDRNVQFPKYCVPLSGDGQSPEMQQ
jgi:hypothetical protein